MTHAGDADGCCINSAIADAARYRAGWLNGNARMARQPLRFAPTALLMSAALSLTACAQSGGPAIAGPGACDASKVQWAVGQAAEKEVVGRAWRESGAGLIRPIAPGQAVRRSVRTDRLTIYIDGGNVITALSCR